MGEVMKVFAALACDSQQGWIWLKDATIPPRSVVKITNLKTKKTIYCEALQIDNNFLKEYNQAPRLNINNPSETIVINHWYRASLGGLATQEDAKLKIQICNSWYGKIKACTDHPQAVVRVAVWLGVIGILLGLIGLIPFIKECFTECLVLAKSFLSRVSV